MGLGELGLGEMGHSAVAVSPLPLRKFRKNYVSAVRVTYYVKKSVAPLPFPPAVPP